MFHKYGFNTSFKPYNTLRQMLVHPKDKLDKTKRSGVVYGITCDQEACTDSYIGETAQPLHKRMYQHRRPSTSGLNDSAVYSHLDTSGHSFTNRDVRIIDVEPRWLERGIKEAIYARAASPSLNRDGGLRYHLSGTWNRAVRGLPPIFWVEAPRVTISSEEAIEKIGETVSTSQ